VALSRQSLEREADTLGIPWTSETTDEQLEALIEAKQKGESVMSQEHIEEKPDCFGELWDAVGESQCTACEIKDSCLDAFSEMVPTLQKSLGNPALPILAKAISEDGFVSEEAILFALGHAEKKAEAKPKRERTPVKLEVLEGGKDEQNEDQPVEGEREVPTEKKVAKKAKKKVAKKKVTKKKAKKKATKSANPPVAAPAKSAKATATKKKKSAMTAKARGGHRPEWGEETYDTRFDKERAKSKLVGLIPDGATLQRIYKGKEYQVTLNLETKRYQCQGKEYPTLYAVTKAITGTKPAKRQRAKAGDESTRPEGTRNMSNWSGPKFWKLKAVLTSADLLG
jgi:hypothetical protein